MSKQARRRPRGPRATGDVCLFCQRSAAVIVCGPKVYAVDGRLQAGHLMCGICVRKLQAFTLMAGMDASRWEIEHINGAAPPLLTELQKRGVESALRAAGGDWP